MAANNFTATTPTGGVAVANDSAAHTVLSVTAPTNQRVKVLGLSVWFNGIAPTGVPVEVRLAKQTAGTGTGTTNTLVNTNGAAETIQSTSKRAYSAEPTETAVVERWTIHPQLGNGENLPLTREYIIPGGGQYALTIVNGSGASLQVNADLICEE